MQTFWLMILLVALGSVVSLIGGIYLLYGKRGAKKLQAISIPLAAGALLAAAFLDLLPEASEQMDMHVVLLIAFVAFLAFYLFDRFLSGGHHHDHSREPSKNHGNSALIVIGDVTHNFVDGLALGAAFLSGGGVGLVTTLAVTAHEIPREIGDFGLLLKKKMAKKRIVAVNLLGAAASVVGAVVLFAFGDGWPFLAPILLSATAGFFIYIAASDIIPSLTKSERDVKNPLYLVIGAVVVGLLIFAVHSIE